jgi:L-fucose isomerase-like protein
MGVETAAVGVLSIGRKRAGFDQQWNQVMRSKAAAALAATGMRTVGGDDAPVVDEQTTRAALDRLRSAGCTALLVLQPSMGNGQLAMTVAQQWAGPVVLWATPERPDADKVSSCSLVAQHLWASLLRQMRRPFEFVYGHPQDSTLRDALRSAFAVCNAFAIVRQARIGIVGSHAPGFISMEADPFAIQQQLGVQLQRLSLPQFIDRVTGMADAAVQADVARARELKLAMNGVVEADLAVNSRYYLALRELIAEEQLDALAIQEWPELPNVLGQWPYPAIARLSEEGQIVELEGDVDGAVTALAGRALGAGVGYLTDWLEHDARTIHFWHPGMAPLGWLNRPGAEDGPSLGRHFNIDKPLVVDGPIQIDMLITVARFWRCDGRYSGLAFEGRTIRNSRQLTGNTALVEVALDGLPGRDVFESFDTLLHAGLPHHVALFRGHHRVAFQRLARMLRVQWVGG